MKKLLLLLAVTFLAFSVTAQDVSEQGFTKNSAVGFSSDIPQATGQVLFSFNVHSSRYPLGVTVVGSHIILSTTDNNRNNYFEVYNFDGTFVKEVKQSTTSTYGYRDLAFDGQYILGSDGLYIDRIDTSTFTVASSINNNFNFPHRGLAYDPDANVIYSSNGTHNLGAIDASTGSTLKNYGRPYESIFGLAFDKFSNPSRPSLWATTPWKYGVFQLTRIDTSNGKGNYKIDVSSALPDSSLSGGLEISNSVPGYEGKTVAIAVEQHNRMVIFVDLTDADYVMPVAFELTDEFAGNGIETRGMAVNYPYLYSIENGDLSVYDIATDPAHPSLIRTDTTVGHMTNSEGGNKIFVNNNMLFINVTGTTNFGSPEFTALETYSLQNPERPQYLSRLDVHIAIYDAAFYGNYIFLTHGFSADVISIVQFFDDGQLQLIHQYKLETDLNESQFTADVEVDSINKILFVPNNYFSLSGNLLSKIDMYDITDINAIAKLGEVHSSGIEPTRVRIMPNYKIAVLMTATDPFESKIYCYDYSSLNSLKYVNYSYISRYNEAYGMNQIDEHRFLISLPNEGIKEFYWDENTKSFWAGASDSLDLAADIVTYSIPATSSAKIYSVEAGNQKDEYAIVSRGKASAYCNKTHAGEKVQVFKAKVPKAGDQYTLTMKIEPSEAAANGCNVIPAPGAHLYKANTELNIYALDNANEGWFFTGWSGDASGKEKIHHIIMDSDKDITGNFEQVKLTVDGTSIKETLCPLKALEYKGLFTINIKVCASEVDDWQLQKISLRAGGTGDDLNDIDTVRVIKGTDFDNVIYIGRYNADDGKIDLTFNPPISIKAGSCVDLFASYFFRFDPDSYASDEPKTFYAETFGTVAQPVHYADGLIQGQAKSDTFTIARVFNSKEKGFSLIQEAIDDNTTGWGDTCFVCSGKFDEIVKIDKPVTALSVYGADKTEVTAFSLVKRSDESEINGFKIGGSEMPSTYGINAENVHLVKIRNNIFSSHYNHIKLSNVFDFVIEKNIFYSASDIALLLKNTSGLKIRNNDFVSTSFNEPTIYDLAGKNNSYGGNIFKGNELKIKFQNSKDTHIYNNKSTSTTIIGPKVMDFNNVKGMKIIGNENMNIIAENIVFSNLEENELGLIWIKGKYDGNIIQYNYFKEPGSGIRIEGNGRINDWIERPSTSIIGNEFHGVLAGIQLKHASLVSIEKNNIPVLMPIDMEDVTRILINKNEIGFSLSGAVRVKKATKIFILENEIKNSKVGISLEDIDDGNVSFNNLYNCETGIGINNVKNTKFIVNKLYNNTGGSTGFHATNSNISLINNEIRANSGGGIIFENGSNGIVNFNNIYDNENVQAANYDNIQKPDISNNYWGSANGPTENDIQGNFLINGYLSEPVSLVMNAASDTIRTAVGKTDSMAIFVSNFVKPNDDVTISISDEKGWLGSPGNQQLTLDTNFTVVNVKFTVPASAGENSIDKFTVKAVSVSDTTVSATKSFTVLTFIPKIYSVIIIPDSVTLNFGDTLRFFAQGLDQSGDTIKTPILWNSDRGYIDSTGIFVSDSTTGPIEIIANALGTSVNARASVYNTNDQIRLAKVKISPDSINIDPKEFVQFSVRGWNQFGYPQRFDPIWTTSGGEINSYGLYLADSIPGQNLVIVSDTLTSLADTAIVNITPLTGIAKETIPDEYMLEQNFPNPFNPATIIQYSIPEESRVTLEIYNILGQRVTTLVNRIEKAGIKRVIWNASQFASGIYFYRLCAGNFMQVKKMILLK